MPYPSLYEMNQANQEPFLAANKSLNESSASMRESEAKQIQWQRAQNDNIVASFSQKLQQLKDDPEKYSRFRQVVLTHPKYSRMVADSTLGTEGFSILTDPQNLDDPIEALKRDYENKNKAYAETRESRQANAEADVADQSKLELIKAKDPNANEADQRNAEKQAKLQADADLIRIKKQVEKPRLDAEYAKEVADNQLKLALRKDDFNKRNPTSPIPDNLPEDKVVDFLDRHDAEVKTKIAIKQGQDKAIAEELGQLMVSVNTGIREPLDVDGQHHEVVTLGIINEVAKKHPEVLDLYETEAAAKSRVLYKAGMDKITGDLSTAGTNTEALDRWGKMKEPIYAQYQTFGTPKERELKKKEQKDVQTIRNQAMQYSTLSSPEIIKFVENVKTLQDNLADDSPYKIELDFLFKAKQKDYEEIFANTFNNPNWGEQHPWFDIKSFIGADQSLDKKAAKKKQDFDYGPTIRKIKVFGEQTREKNKQKRDMLSIRNYGSNTTTGN